MQSKPAKRFLEGGAKSCPFCNHADIYDESPSPAPGHKWAYKNMACTNCKKAWRGIYELVDIEDEFGESFEED